MSRAAAFPFLACAFFSISASSEELTVYEAAADPNAIWYSGLRGVWENNDQLFAIGYNIAGGQFDPTGSANNEKPWLHNGGLDNVGPEVSVKRMLWMPPSTKIFLYPQTYRFRGGLRNGFRFGRHNGIYPATTLAAEFHYDGQELFEIRSRRRDFDGVWETDQIDVGPKPNGYEPVDNCVECHEDIAKHSFQLDPRREWYGTVRGLERHGPIAFHPWIEADAYHRIGAGAQKILRPDMRDRVQLVSDKKTAQRLAKEQDVKIKASLESDENSSVPVSLPGQDLTSSLVRQLLTHIHPVESDILCHPNCGDGRVLIMAAEMFGCQGIGIESDHDRADVARQKVSDAGLADRIVIRTGDPTQLDSIESATIVFAYLFEDALEKLVAMATNADSFWSLQHEIPGVERQVSNLINGHPNWRLYHYRRRR